jgi:hypothetical protein
MHQPELESTLPPSDRSRRPLLADPFAANVHDQIISKAGADLAHPLTGGPADLSHKAIGAREMRPVPLFSNESAGPDAAPPAY